MLLQELAALFIVTELCQITLLLHICLKSNSEKRLAKSSPTNSHVNPSHLLLCSDIKTFLTKNTFYQHKGLDHIQLEQKSISYHTQHL